MGRVQQAAGESFESLVNFANSLYRNRQQAMVEQNGVRGEWRVSRGKPFFKAWPKAEQPPDYSGVIAGRHVVFDAKTTQNKQTWSLPKAARHQLAHMRDAVGHGALAWFAVEWRRYEALVLLRVHESMEDGGARISWKGVKDAEQRDSNLHLVVHAKDGWYDWLPAVERWWL